MRVGRQGKERVGTGSAAATSRQRHRLTGDLDFTRFHLSPGDIYIYIYIHRGRPHAQPVAIDRTEYNSSNHQLTYTHFFTTTTTTHYT